MGDRDWEQSLAHWREDVYAHFGRDVDARTAIEYLAASLAVAHFMAEEWERLARVHGYRDSELLVPSRPPRHPTHFRTLKERDRD